MDPSVVNPPFPVTPQFQPTPAPAFIPPSAPAPATVVAYTPPIYAVNPVANPTPVPNYGNNPSHPPYSEMITSAIMALREQDGSSKKAISKYIDRMYTDLPPAHSALLTHHLKRLKNSKQLIMIKKSYTLPSLAAANHGYVAPQTSPSTSATPKRRGRPPKNSAPPLQAVFAPDQEDMVQESLSISAAPASVDLSSHSVINNGGTSTNTRKGRGRPPKRKLLNLTGTPLDNLQLSRKKGRGRPPKSRSIVTFNVPDTPATEKKKPGRPSLGVSSPSPSSSGRPRGRPRKSAVAVAPDQQLVGFPVPAPVPASVPASVPVDDSIKRRGRPPKRYLDEGGVAVVSMKRRGRPPMRGGGALRIPKMWKTFGVSRGRGRGRGRGHGRSGKSPGRPTKVQPSDSHVLAGQLAAANEELTRKLEYMQLKVKKAVGLLRPHVSNLENLDIMTAMEDLQEVAEIDLKPTATATEPEPEPTTVPSVDAVAPMVDDASAEAATAGEGASPALIEVSTSEAAGTSLPVMDQEPRDN